jgi:uncharacterized membrane protein YfcA
VSSPGALAPPLPESVVVPPELSLEVPPVPVVPVVPVAAVPELVVVPVPVEPDWSLGAVVEPGSAVGVGVGVALPLELSEEPLAEVSRFGSVGIGTSTGAPGTSW